MKKIVSVLLAIFIVVGIITSAPFTVKASEEFLVETIKDDVPLWSEPRKASTKVRVVEEKGTLFLVKAQVENEYDHIWYLLENRNWVYSENVRRHNHKSVKCGVPEKKYSCIDEKRHSVSTTDFDLCDCGYRLNERYKNTAANHNFTNGDAVCIDCGYVFNRVFEDCDILVEIGEDCNTFTGPTKYSQKTNRQLLKGETYKVVKKVNNEFQHEWFVLEDDGSYFYAGHISHQHQGRICGQGNITYEAVSESEHIRYNYGGDELCDCGYKVADGTTTSVTESHDFFQGVCTDCGFVYNLEFTENKAWVQLKEDCYSFSAPYKDSSEKDFYLAGDSVFILGSVVNEYNNTWIKLDDNRFIYEGHVDHVHIGEPVAEKYEQNNAETHIAIYHDGEYCSCGFKTSESSKFESAEEAHNFDGKTFCSKCGYRKEAEPADTSNDDTESQTDVSSVTETKDVEDDSADYEKTESDTKSVDETNEEETYDGDDSSEDFVCVDYKDCTENDSKIFVITEDNCPIREEPSGLGKVYTRAKKDQLISVKRVFWTWRFSRWAEIRLPDSDNSYYIYIGNCEEHTVHSFVNVVTTEGGKIEFCTLCGVTAAETQDEVVTFSLISVLDQVIMGTYSDEQASIASIVAQIIVGEVMPGSVSTAADLRDLLGDIHNGESMGVLFMDMVVIFPVGTLVKGSDKLSHLTRNADEIAAIVNKGSDITKGSRHIKATNIVTDLSGEDYIKARKLAQNYKITEFRYNEHVIKEHYNTWDYINKTKFNKGFDIKKAIDEVLSSPDEILKNKHIKSGGFVYRKDFGCVIGYEPLTQKQITKIRVVLYPDGSVNTAFPDVKDVY